MWFGLLLTLLYDSTTVAELAFSEVVCCQKRSIYSASFDGLKQGNAEFSNIQKGLQNNRITFILNIKLQPRKIDDSRCFTLWPCCSRAHYNESGTAALGISEIIIYALGFYSPGFSDSPNSNSSDLGFLVVYSKGPINGLQVQTLIPSSRRSCSSSECV